MKLLAGRLAGAIPRGGLLLCALAAGALVAVLPSLTLQLGLVVGLAAALSAVILARTGRVLNPAWVIVIGLYLIGPIGTYLVPAGIGLPITVVAALVPAPFVVAVLATHREARDRLMLLAPLASLLVLAAVSVAWSSDPQYGVSKLGLAIFTAFLPAAYVLVLAAASQRVSWGLVVGLALVSAVGLIAFGTASADYPGRPTLFNANPIWAARAVFVGALVALFGPFPLVVRIAAAPAMIVAGLLTVSLGPAVGLVVGAWAGVAEALRCREHLDRRIAVVWIALGLAIAGMVFAILSGAVGPIRPELLRVVDDPNVTSRATYLDVSSSLFIGSPFLGIGVGGFAASGLDVYPHNLVAEIAAELGLIGLLSLLAWVLMALRGAARSPLLVALVVATGVFSLFSGSLASNSEFWMFTGLAVASFPVRGAARVARYGSHP
jgi:O-antigen ligase